MTPSPISLIAWCLLGLAASAQGQIQVQTSSVFLEDLTWTELKREVAAGKTTIIVPIGGTEQNGPHMALGKHNARVRALSEKIARELGNAIVAPVIAYVPEGNVDPPSSHMRFPGTITIPDKTFEQVLESAARSFKLHGFRDVVFLGDHVSYQKDLQAVADRLNREWAATSVRAHAVPEPGPEEILVRVSACAVCRTDLHVVDGELPHPKLPLVPGQGGAAYVSLSA